MHYRFFPSLLALGLCGGLAIRLPAHAQTKPAKLTKNAVGAKAKLTTAKSAGQSYVMPKPLSGNVKRGLTWLVKSQHSSGGWSQGEESAEMGHGLDQFRDKPDVADTCIAALALMRAGSTPRSGEYAGNIRSAVNYVCGEIEESDHDSLYVTSARGTRVQTKLGPYIDTFMSSLLLAEVAGQLGDTKQQTRVAAAYRKVMDKMAKHQKSDGTWDNNGWAPVLGQSLASRAINRAAQNGLKIDEKVRVKAEVYARARIDQKSGDIMVAEAGRTGGYGGGGIAMSDRAGAFAGGGFAGGTPASVAGSAPKVASSKVSGPGGLGGAGVPLYHYASDVASLGLSDATNGQLEQQARDALHAGKTPEARKQAQVTLDRIAGNRRDFHTAQQAVVAKISDPRFMAGFGSNGGEEFLSYMNIGESLVVKGGSDWEKWDKSITTNLNNIQNSDGTWSGQHCITGRTFCTSAALLVLMTDRARTRPAPKPRHI